MVMKKKTRKAWIVRSGNAPETPQTKTLDRLAKAVRQKDPVKMHAETKAALDLKVPRRVISRLMRKENTKMTRRQATAFIKTARWELRRETVNKALAIQMGDKEYKSPLQALREGQAPEKVYDAIKSA